MNEQNQPDSEDASKQPEQGRGRSTIEFPYLDLLNAVEVAQAVKAIGGVSADWGQLAVKLDMSPDGGGFRLRVGAGKVFGLLDTGRNTVDLTDLGVRILEAQHERAAKVEAFLRVPLFKVLFDKLNGQTLPPPAALERMAEQAGVAPKQKDKARQVFMRSAKQAGMFELSMDKLTMPPGLNGGLAKGAAEAGAQTSGQQPPLPPPPASEALHPFIKGLLDKLPPPDTEWAVKDRAKWLTTAANIFDLMYTTSDGAASIEVAVK